MQKRWIKRSNKLRVIVSIVMITFSAYKVSAQDISHKVIKGIVTEEGNKEPLPGAVVLTVPESSPALTDENGFFMLNIADSVHALVISFTGYQKDTIHLNTVSGDSIIVSLKQLLELDDVVISSRKKSTEISMLDAMKVEKIGTSELMKAACCNLSESFETTPSVDVGFTDAISGYKQIQMLGLAGSHTLFTRENIPDVRGLASVTGLTFTPGAWVESMQLSKGSGSVVNGYEGTAGQINVEWKKPFLADEPRLYLNGYQSVQGRSEGNLVWKKKINDHLSTNLLLHGRGDWLKVDMNNDGFMDQPLGKTFAGSNRWFYFNNSGLEIQGGIKAVLLENTGGEIDYQKGSIQESGNPWGYEQALKRFEGWAKIGKVFPATPWKSMGLQLSGTYHDQNSKYGNRDYKANQNSFYANYIYQTIIANTNHVIKGGASFQYDDYDETFQSNQYKRTEFVPGAFAEYAYTYLTKFNLVAGLRADYHNLFGAFITPRLHMRYAPADNTSIRGSIGRAQRTANIFAENMAYMASMRNYIIPQNAANKAFGLDPEVAWNMGLNVTQKFMLNYRDGAFSVDYYYTDFKNQVVVDIESAREVKFYNLAGRSYAHSFQAQLDYEPLRNFDVRLAYRFYDVRTTYEGTLKEKPFIASNRAFANIAYATKNNWKFDYTIQWLGAKRLPERIPNNQIAPEARSPSFIQMNAQISKSWLDDVFEFYVGGENLTNFMQLNLIQGYENPFGNNFDASLIWGPGMGRNFYLGFRYRLK